MRISNSMAKSYLRCSRQYDYKYNKLLTSVTTGLPLYRGSWLHELLQANYETGDWKKRNRQLSKEFMALFEEEREVYGDLPTICSSIMESYCYTWREADEAWTVIAVEQEYEVPLPHGHTFVFKIDMLVEDEYGIWLVEHKSHKTLPDDSYRFMDTQTARYAWGLTQLGIPVIGVVWDYLRTKEPTKPHMNKNGKVSRAKLDTDLFTYVSTLQENGIDLREYKDVILALKRNNTFFRRVTMPKPDIIAATLIEELVTTADQIERGDPPVRTIDRSCAYMCSFTDLCVTELYGGDTSLMLKTKYREATAKDYYANPEKEA